MIEAGGKKSTGASFLNKSKNSSYIATLLAQHTSGKSKTKLCQQDCAPLRFENILRIFLNCN